MGPSLAPLLFPARGDGLLELEQAATLIKRISARGRVVIAGSVHPLLSRAVAARPLSGRTKLAGAAEVLLAALPAGSDHTVSQHSSWNRPRTSSADLVVDVLIAVGGINEALTMRVASHILAWPKTYDLDVVLIPAVVAPTAATLSASSTIPRKKLDLESG